MNETETDARPTWKCLQCGAVCHSDPEVVPAPCDYCASDNVVPYDEAPADAPPDVVHKGDMD